MHWVGLTLLGDERLVAGDKRWLPSVCQAGTAGRTYRNTFRPSVCANDIDNDHYATFAAMAGTFGRFQGAMISDRLTPWRHALEQQQRLPDGGIVRRRLVVGLRALGHHLSRRGLARGEEIVMCHVG